MYILTRWKAKYIPGKIGPNVYFPDEIINIVVGNVRSTYPSSFPFLLLGLWTENSRICVRDNRSHCGSTDTRPRSSSISESSESSSSSLSSSVQHFTMPEEDSDDEDDSEDSEIEDD